MGVDPLGLPDPTDDPRLLPAAIPGIGGAGAPPPPPTPPVAAAAPDPVPPSGSGLIRGVRRGRAGDLQYPPTAPVTAPASVAAPVFAPAASDAPATPVFDPLAPPPMPSFSPSPPVAAPSAKAPQIPGLDASTPVPLDPGSGSPDGSNATPPRGDVASTRAPAIPGISTATPDASGGNASSSSTVPPPGQDVSTAGATPPKPYSVGGDGSLSFQPGKLADGLLAAHQDGVVDSDGIKNLLPKAIDADKAFSDQQSLQARVSADDYAKAKAFATGAARGGTFLAGALPGAETGAAVGAAIPVLGETGIGELLGGAVGGLIGGYGAQKAGSTLGNVLAQHSDTIKSFADASQALPQYDAAGNLVSMIVPGAAGLAKLGKVASIRAAAVGAGDMTAAQAIGQTAKEIGTAAAAGAAFEGVVRPSFDYVLNQGKAALGITPQAEAVLPPTVKSTLESAILGVALSNLGTKFEGYNATDIQGLFNKGRAAAAASSDGRIPPGTFTPAETDALVAARNKFNQAAANGQFNPATFKIQVQQALNTDGSVRAQSSSVSGFDAPHQLPPSAVPSTSPTPPVPALPAAPSPGAPDGTVPSPQAGAPVPGAAGAPASPSSPAPAVPGAPAVPAASSPGAPASSPSIPGVAAGQAAVPEAGDTFIHGGVRYSITSADADTVTVRPESAPAGAPPLPMPRASIEHLLTTGTSSLEKAPVAAAPSPVPDAPASTVAPASPASPGTPAPPAADTPAPPAVRTPSGGAEVSPRQDPTTPTAPDNEPNPNLPGTRPAPVQAEAPPPQAPAATADPAGRSRIPGLDAPTEDRAPTVRPAAEPARAPAAGDAGAEPAGAARQPDGRVTPPTGVSTPPPVSLPSTPTDDRKDQSDARPTTTQEEAQPGGRSSPDRPGAALPPATVQPVGSSGADQQPARGDIRRAGRFGDLDAQRAVEAAHAEHAAADPDAPTLRATTFAPPARVSVPRQTEEREVPNDSGTGTKVIPPDSDNAAAAREWLADQRAAGKNPSAMDVTRATKVPPATTQRLLDDQNEAEYAANESAKGSGITYGQDGQHEVAYDPARLAQSMQNVQDSGGNAHAWVRSAVGEEMIHARDTRAGDEAGGAGQVRDAIWKTLPEANRQAMAKAYGDIPAPAHLTGDDATQFKQRVLAAEYVRALAQRRAGEPVTESHFTDTKPLEALLDGPQPPAVERQMARMHRLMPPVVPPTATPSQDGQPVSAQRTVLEKSLQLTVHPPGHQSAQSPTAKSQETSGVNQSPSSGSLVPSQDHEQPTPENIHRGSSPHSQQTPTAPAKQPRSFTLPDAPAGHADVIDHIREQGGMVSRAQASKRDTFTKYAGDYDGAPDLKGIYHYAVYGGKLMPDQMAETLHQEHGVGDGSVDGMWNAIDKARALRTKIRAQYKKNALQEQQAARFARDTSKKKKGEKAVHVGNLNVGDVLTVHGEKMKVIDLDPDTLDVTLQDHSRYGVQKVDEGQVLYVEQVKKAPTSADFAPAQDGEKTPPAPDRPSAQPPAAPAPATAPASAQRQDAAPAPSGAGASPAPRGSASDTPVSSPQPQTTIKGLVGKPINTRRTAFAPAADSLGIPRDQMPQVAAEHRGALAQFLQARGIDWQNADVLPGSLKPSQADFNPGKVKKAMDWVGDSERRILISSDDRVIDGHHQWMARLANHPNEPMPVVRLDAPARDILSQIHEFPSAGMESAPDIEPEADSPDFNLESPTADQLDAEAEKRRQREAIADRQARKLAGKDIDTTGDMLDPLAAENPLFSQGLGAAIPPQSRAQMAERGDDYRELQASNATVAGPATFTLAAAKPSNPLVDRNGVHALAKPRGSAYLSEDEQQRDPAHVLASLVRGGDATDQGQPWKHGRPIASHSRLVAWAARAGRNVDPARFDAALSSGASHDGGGEHVVLYDRARGIVLKLTKPGLYGAQGTDAGAYLQRWALHNRAFGDDARFEGLVHLPGESEPRAVISQPWVNERDSTVPEQEDYLRGKGYRKQADGMWIHPATKLKVWDTVTPGNAKTDSDGKVQPIDLQIAPAEGSELERAQNDSGIGGKPLFAAKPATRDSGSDNAVDEPSTWAKVTEALAHLTSKEGAVGSAMDDIAKVFVPAARGEHAKLTAEALQEVTAQMARNQVQQAAVLKGMRTMVARMPAADQRSLLFDLDEGRAPANPDLAAAFEQFRKLDADRIDSMKETLKRYGVNDLDDFNRYADTIIPHLFKDPDKAEQVFSAMEKKMSGSTGFLKPRSQYTYRELARFGLEPKTNNFVDLAAARWWMQERFLGALQLADEMEKAGTGHWETGDYTAKADEEEIGHRLLSKTGQNEGKPRKLKFFAREEAARVVKNYLSEGLRGKPWFQAYLGAANRLNGAQLGLSFFHGGFITTESVTSQLANAIHMAAHGDFARAAAAAIRAPISPVLDYKLGKQLVGEWNKPGSQGEAMGQLLRHIISGGGRGNMDSIYNENDTEKFLDALRQKAYASAVLRAPFAAVEQLARPIMERYVPYLKMAAAAKMIQAELERNPNATPVQMRSMAAEAVRSTNNRFGQMVYDNLHLHKVVKDILMGMTRSLGWNWGTFAEIGGGVKDFLKAGINIAPKITFGAGGRGSGGAGGGGGGGGEGPGGTEEEPLFSAGGVNVFKGKTPQFTQKMAYVLALPLVAGIMGAALNAAFGQKAEQLKDYYFPKTGDKDDKGRPIRLSLPTYMKDVFAFADSPTTTITNKLHPLLSMLAQMFENKDFYGTEIRHPDDPYLKQAIQELKFVGTNTLPFTITNLAKTSQDGASPIIKGLGFVGFGKAAARIGETDAEKLADSLVIDRMPQGTRTQEQANKSQLKGTILNAARQGNLSPMRAAVNAGKLTPQEAHTIETRAKLTPLQDRVHSLGLDDAEKVLAVATPAERQELAPVMDAKYAAARKAGRAGSQTA